MNHGRVALSFTVVPLVLLLERAAFWGSRALLGVYLTSTLGATSTASIASVLTVSSVLSSLFVFIGAGLAFVVGPAIPIAIGLALAIGGFLVMAFSSSTAGVWIAVVIGALAQGLYRPCIWALAASELGRNREHLRNLSFVVLYATLNVSALASPPIFSSIGNSFGYRGAFFTSAAIDVVALLVAIGLAIGWQLFGRRAAPASTPEPSTGLGKIALAVIGLAALAALYSFSLSIFNDTARDRLRAGGASLSSHAMLSAVNPISVVVISLLFIPLLLVFHFLRVKASSFHLIAVGLTLLGLSVIPLLLDPSGTIAQAGTQIGIGIAEVVTGPLIGARMAGDLPPKFAAPAIALWQFASGGASLVAFALSELVRKVNLVLSGLLAVLFFVLGAALIFAAAPLARAIYDREP